FPRDPARVVSARGVTRHGLGERLERRSPFEGHHLQRRDRTPLASPELDRANSDEPGIGLGKIEVVPPLLPRYLPDRLPLAPAGRGLDRVALRSMDPVDHEPSQLAVGAEVDRQPRMAFSGAAPPRGPGVGVDGEGGPVSGARRGAPATGATVESTSLSSRSWGEQSPRTRKLNA